MNPQLAALLQDQLAAGLVDFEGAHISAVIPVAERLLNDVIVRTLPPTGAVRQALVRPRAGNRFDLTFKLAKPGFLPPFSVTAEIERQPEFPQSPVLVLRLSSFPGLISAAGFGASLFDVLPPGVSMQGDRVLVNLAALMQQNGAGFMLPWIERVAIRTDEGRVLIEVESRVTRGPRP